MCDSPWPTLPFAESSPWRSFVTKVASPPLTRSAPSRRIDLPRRAACANWWTLGITLGLFTGGALLHPAQGQSLDYLKVGTTLLRKRHSGALTPTAIVQQFALPSGNAVSSVTPEVLARDRE